MERPELSSHYQAAKDAFEGRTNWCSVCKGFECQMNNTECKKYSATLELLEFLHDLPSGSRPNFTMHDFFNAKELEYFLQNFTLPVQWTENKAPISVNGINVQLVWPRKLVGDIDLCGVRRWDQRTRKNYLQRSWDGFIRPYMFEKLDLKSKLYERHRRCK